MACNYCEKSQIPIIARATVSICTYMFAKYFVVVLFWADTFKNWCIDDIRKKLAIDQYCGFRELPLKLFRGSDVSPS